jgi:hypothetical protein
MNELKVAGVSKQSAPVASGVIRRKCSGCKKKEKEKEKVRLQRTAVRSGTVGDVPPIVHEVLRSPGQSLDAKTRAFMEHRFNQDFSRVKVHVAPQLSGLTIGPANDRHEQQADRVADSIMQSAPSHEASHKRYDFGQVRVHTDSRAAESARAVNARAYTVAHNMVFAADQYAPETKEGRRLLAHELTHVIQQSAVGTDLEHSSMISRIMPLIQRTLGDGHDLTSPRFSLLLDLEAAYDGERVVSKGSSGRGVQAIQQALYDLGYPLPAYGADGKFGRETEAAVKAFQRANPPLVDDGKVGRNTMAALDARFSGAPALPAPATLSAPWTETCVQSVLCPWSPHTIEVLRTRITLKSFNSISWADEMWDGAYWVPAPFPGGGYNTGTEIGVLNDSCEGMSETLYHEVLHAEQPTTHRTTRDRESYAYRIGEEFSIAMGLGGRPALRSTDAQGRQYADPAKVETFVATTYPSVPAGSASDEIIGKATTHGHVRVQRPNGTVYTRPAVVGEKVPGPMVTNPPGGVVHPTAGWICP